MAFLFSNNAKSNLAGAITNTALTANLSPGTGILFPVPTGSNSFVGSFHSAANNLITEIVHVTNVTGDTITMVRAQEGTDPLAWIAGDIFKHGVTAGQMGAMLQSKVVGGARIVTTSGVFVMTRDDNAIGLQRVAAPAASSTTLPSDAEVGDIFTFEDLTSNFQAYPVTINAPAGHNIANETEIILNVNRQSSSFRFYGANTWGVKL